MHGMDVVVNVDNEAKEGEHGWEGGEGACIDGGYEEAGDELVGEEDNDNLGSDPVLCGLA